MERSMRLRFVAMIAGLATLVPLTAFADPDAPPVIRAVSTVHPGEALVCDFFYHQGDLIRRQDCRTRSQWNRLRVETQREISEFQVRSLIQRN
jgi:hypothetical protein